MSDLIVVTDWEKADEDDFYLEDQWLVDSLGMTKQEAKELRRKTKEGDVFKAYIIQAKSYALYSQMDADLIFIDSDGDELFHGETEIIDNSHQEKWEHEGY